MFSYIDNLKIKWVSWFVARAHSTNFKTWLAFIAFTESIILPFPTAAFLILILMAGSKRWLYYATFTTFFSVLGGIFGYVIGALFFDTVGLRIVEFYNLGAGMEVAKTQFNDSAFMVNLIGAFTPIPYKIFTLSSGFLKINFFAFLSASIIGRSMQFFLVAYLTKLYGSTVARLVMKYFNIIVLVLIFVSIIYFVFL